MSPALALAMALGLRNVQGPVERRHAESARVERPSSARQATLLTGAGAYKKSSSNAAGIRLALED